MIRFFSAVILLLIIASSTRATIRHMTDLERIGLSDLIIIGTVEEVMNRDKTVSQNTVAKPIDIAIVHVDKILKGNPVETVEVTNLPVASPGEKGRIYTGAKLLFFLHQSRNRFKLYRAGDPFLLPLSDVEKISALLHSFPIIIDLVSPTDVIAFEQPFTLTVKITNVSDRPIGISEINLEGFYYSSTLELNLGNRSRVAIEGSHMNSAKSTVIEPGTTYKVDLKFALEKPASWKTYTPESYLLTFAAMRVILTVDQNLPREDPQDIYLVASPLVCAVVGFPQPIL